MLLASATPVSKAKGFTAPKPAAAAAVPRKPCCLSQHSRRLLLSPLLAANKDESGLPDNYTSSRNADDQPSTKHFKVPRTGDLTGNMPEGPQEVNAGRYVESSDTNPALDPSEQPSYTRREGELSSQASEAADAIKTAFKSDHDERTKGRDASDAQGVTSSSGAGSSESSHPRTHPVARTAGTAIGSAAGVVLGGVAGPAGAAAGAALGASAGRKIVDALSGTEKQAEVYDQGAEPEQVAEEVVAAAAPVKERLAEVKESAASAADDLAEDIRGRAKQARSAASDLAEKAADKLDRATEQSSHDTGGSTTSRTHKSHHESHSSQKSPSSSGVTNKIKHTAEKVADKVVDATDKIPLPTFPPQNADDESRRHKSHGAAEARSADDSAASGGWGEGSINSGRDWGGLADPEQVVKADVGHPALAQSDQMGMTEAVEAETQGRIDEAVREVSDIAQRNMNISGPHETGTVDQGSEEWTRRARVAPEGSSSSAGGLESAVSVDVPAGAGAAGTPDYLRGVGGAAAAAGGYGGDLINDPIDKEGDVSVSGSTKPVSDTDATRPVPEGRLTAGGADAQAAVGVEAESTGVTTSDSTAERVAQVYGIGPEASGGAEEASIYRAEADKDPHKKA